MTTEKKPVIVFIYGGAWINGEKELYSLVGKTLSESGFVTIIPDYTLYPGGRIETMLKEIKEAVEWTKANCEQFGGDSQRIFVCGHSAGAQLVCMGMVRDALAPEGDQQGSLCNGISGIIG